MLFFIWFIPSLNLLCSQISELFTCIREATRDHLAGAAANNMGEGTDPSGSVKATFEIRYLGRARVHSRKLSSEVMDTLAERLTALDEEHVIKKLEEKERRERHASGASIKVSCPAGEWRHPTSAFRLDFPLKLVCTHGRFFCRLWCLGLHNTCSDLLRHIKLLLMLAFPTAGLSFLLMRSLSCQC